MSYVKGMSLITRATANHLNTGFSYVGGVLTKPVGAILEKVGGLGQGSVFGEFPELSTFYDFRLYASAMSSGSQEKTFKPVVRTSVRHDGYIHEQCVVSMGFMKQVDAVVGLVVNESYGPVLAVSINKTLPGSFLRVDFAGMQLFSGTGKQVSFIMRTVDAHAVKIYTNFPAFGIHMRYYEELPLATQLEYCVRHKHDNFELRAKNWFMIPNSLSMLPKYDGSIAMDMFSHVVLPVVSSKSFTYVKVTGEAAVLFGSALYVSTSEVGFVVPNPAGYWVHEFIVSFSVKNSIRVQAYVRENEEDIGNLTVLLVHEQVVKGVVSKI